MKTQKKLSLGLIFLVSLLFLGASACSTSEHGDLEVATGELIFVDPDEQSLILRTADNQQLKFFYNDETEVDGTDNSIAGLSTQGGNQLEIQYRLQETRRLAVKLNVERSAYN